MPTKGTALAARFWSRIRKTDGCWLWTGVDNGHGYGVIRAGGRGGRTLLAHRVSWELHHGPIPAGVWVLHRCDVRACVRPDHLFLGDATANNRDMARKGRHGQSGATWMRGEGNGHAKLTDTAVRGIRAEYAAGAKQVALARRYGVHQTLISLVVRRKVWFHV